MIFVASLLVAMPSEASTSDRGKIVEPTANNAGRTFFSHTGPRTQRPVCSGFDRWVIDTSTSQGQSMLALLLTAYGQNKAVTVRGTGDCRDWPDTEAIDIIVVHG